MEIEQIELAFRESFPRTKLTEAYVAFANAVEEIAIKTKGKNGSPPMTAKSEPAESGAKWPKGREAGRIGDMAPPDATHLRVGLDASNDVYVAIWDNESGRAQSASIEFCTGMGGGGQSPRTREALIALMVAMEADNAEAPSKQWPPADGHRSTPAEQPAPVKITWDEHGRRTVNGELAPEHKQPAPAESGAVRLPPLPDAIRVPLDELHADAAYLVGRVKLCPNDGDLIVAAIRRKLDALRAALAEQARPIEPYPARKVGGTFEADGRVLAEFDNDGTPMVAFKFNALPMIHLYRKDQIAASPQPQDQRDSAPARDVLAERRRQIEQEGWTPEHDDEHDRGELADAAACYAWDGESPTPPLRWPWRDEWWKPKGRRSGLVRAGALILAEIERLDRAAKHGRSHAERPDDPESCSGQEQEDKR